MTTYRDNLIGLVADIASIERQLNYEKNVPIANVPAELFCQWFDDLYHPDTDLFKETFSEEERDHLARFHQYFEERADKISEVADVTELQKFSEWQEISNYASEILIHCGWQDVAT